MRPKALKEGLLSLSAENFWKERVAEDPIEFLYRYSDPRDVEVAGLIASSFAYGRIGLFKPVLEKIFFRLGPSPSQYLLRLDLKQAAREFQGLYYRFSAEKDLLAFLFLIHKALEKYGSLEALFLRHYASHGDLKKGLTGFVEDFFREDLAPVYGRHQIPRGLAHLLPHPSTGGACKRLNLYLRWMVRDKEGDLGIWKKVSSSHLMIPLDTHLARISRKIGFSSRSSPDWRMAEEIAASLKLLDQNDPVRFDFTLCHLGVSGRCPPVSTPQTCGCCPLREGCETGMKIGNWKLKNEKCG